MNLVSAIAIYFVLWWLCLLMMLPFGIRSAWEAGEQNMIEHDSGAPTKPGLRRKILFATMLAFVPLFLIEWGLSSSWLQYYWS